MKINNYECLVFEEHASKFEIYSYNTIWFPDGNLSPLHLDRHGIGIAAITYSGSFKPVEPARELIKGLSQLPAELY